MSSITIQKDGDTTPPRSVRELVDRYFRETVLRPASQATYMTTVRVFERDAGVSDLGTINRQHVFAWRDAILGRASLATWNSYRREMKTLFNFAERNGWVVGNPFREVGPVVMERRKKTVTKAVLNEAIQVLESDDPPAFPGWFWVIALRLLLFSGMRRRQLAALRWRDLDFERQIILLTTEGSKTRREWEIPMPPQCVDDLLELRKRFLAEKCKNMEDRQVFWIQLFNPRFRSKELTPSHVSNAFHRISRRLEKKVTAHRLRHTMATDLAQGANPDLKSLQYLLGHSNIQTTLEYVSPEMSQLRLQLSRLSLNE